MKGTVRAVGPATGYLAVEVDGGDYSILEPMGGCDADIGDELQGDLESLGGVTLRNLSSGSRIEVYIQDIYTSPAVARRMLAGG